MIPLRRQLRQDEINECQICFKFGWHKHHISYFPEHIIKICDSCHAVITFSKDSFLDVYRQYVKGDRQKWEKINRLKSQDLRISESPRHAKMISYSGYF